MTTAGTISRRGSRGLRLLRPMARPLLLGFCCGAAERAAAAGTGFVPAAAGVVTAG